MSATKKPDVSFNVTTSLKHGKVDIETGDDDYCVAEFYEVFKDQLPCLVVVDQGFYSPLIEDTFDKEQMLLLKTTSSQKRVLGKMVGVERQQTKLISLPASYREKLFIFKNGKVEKKTTLDVILKENSLPCKVAFADSREVIADDRAMSTRGVTIIELTELFDEVYFLGNCVNFGQLALNVIRVPFYLSCLTFKIVKGFKDGSTNSFKEYFKKLLLVSSFLNYNIPRANMKIAAYDPQAVHSKRKLSLLQPNLYTDYETLTQIPAADNYTELDVLKPAPQDTRDSKITTKQYNSKKASSGTSANANMSRNSSLDETLPRDRPSRPLPMESTPPTDIPDRKLRSEPLTMLAETDGPTIPKVFGPKAHTVAKEDEGRDKKPFDPKPNYNNKDERDEQRVAVGKSLPILATQNQGMLQFDGTASTTSNVTEQRGKRPIDVKTLSIQGVCECLTHLNLREYIKPFRDDLINGDILMDIDRDTLCAHFGMNKIEALRLVKFAATGRIPT